MQAEAETRAAPSLALVLIAGLAALALGVAFMRGWEPGIRGEWVWRRNELPVQLLSPLAIGVALAALTALLCRRGAWQRMTRPRRVLSFAALILIVFALQLALLNAVGVPWVAPGAYIISPNTTTYFAVSLGVQSPAEWVARYPELLPYLPYHAATHPPGLVLFFWLVRKVAAVLPVHAPPAIADVLIALGDDLGLALTPADAAGAIISVLLIAFIGALGLVGVYLLARSLSTEQTAICATCLAGAMPGVLLLGASPDLIVMALATAGLYCKYAAYRGSWLSALLAGLVFAVGLFLSLAFALVVVWAGVWLLVGLVRSSDRPAAARRALRAEVLAAASFLAIYVALYLIWGYRPIAAALQALSAHRGVTMLEAARTYWKWVLMNPVECAIFAGVPTVVGALWSLPRLRESSRLASFLAAWLILFALLDVSGAVRGEVGRIWLFLLWPIAIAAGSALSDRVDVGRATALLVFMQVAQALMMKGYVTIYSIL